MKNSGDLWETWFWSIRCRSRNDFVLYKRIHHVPHRSTYLYICTYIYDSWLYIYEIIHIYFYRNQYKTSESPSASFPRTPLFVPNDSIDLQMSLEGSRETHLSPSPEVRLVENLPDWNLRMRSKIGRSSQVLKMMTPSSGGSGSTYGHFFRGLSLHFMWCWKWWVSYFTHVFSAISGGELIPSLGWWQLKYFLSFSPLTVRDMIQLDEHIFSRWCWNHHLDPICGVSIFLSLKIPGYLHCCQYKTLPSSGPHALSHRCGTTTRNIHWWSRDNRCLQMYIYIHIYMCRLFIYMIIYIYLYPYYLCTAPVTNGPFKHSTEGWKNCRRSNSQLPRALILFCPRI